MVNRLIPSASSHPQSEIRSLFEKAEDNIVIIAPYIKVTALRSILSNTSINITIITSVRLNDLWVGSSDIELFPYSKENNIRVYINNRIHLKLYMTDWKTCIYGSANISKNGLGVNDNYNYELMSPPTKVDIISSIYFKKILSESILMNDAIYQSILLKLNELSIPPTVIEPDLSEIYPDKSFLISSLPMSINIDSLYEIYSNSFNSGDNEARECAMHDVVLFEIPNSLSKDQFIKYLKKRFFESLFVISLLEYIGEDGKYFGMVKGWIQTNCLDVPVPSKRDLTGNVQVLYHWILELSDGKYLVDRPNYSERIFKAKQ